jgi:hypothetical protein
MYHDLKMSWKLFTQPKNLVGTWHSVPDYNYSIRYHGLKISWKYFTQPKNLFGTWHSVPDYNYSIRSHGVKMSWTYFTQPKNLVGTWHSASNYQTVADSRKSSKLIVCKSPGVNIENPGDALCCIIRQSRLSCHCVWT